jgi:pimeloyl-ACP methyl ester carboxylesterase
VIVALIRAPRLARGGVAQRKECGMAPTPLPIILVPGLLCSARLYRHQIPDLWQCGPVMIADHTRDDTMAGIARRILSNAPPRFVLLGLSMGGYIAFEIVRQAPRRVAKLALLDTSARPDTPEQSERRRAQIVLAGNDGLVEIADRLFPILVHRSRHAHQGLQRLVRQMARETGPEAFMRQQEAIMGRPDSRPGLDAIDRRTLVIVGDGDELLPPALSEEIADGIPGARLVVVPQCGHLSTLERPRFVTKTLVDWLRAG